MKFSVSILSLLLCSCGTTQFQGNPNSPEKKTLPPQSADIISRPAPTSPQQELPKPEVETPQQEVQNDIIRQLPPVIIEKEELKPPEVEVVVEEKEERIVLNKGLLSITFLDETAGFQNSLGYYEVSDNGEILNPKIIWENASHSSDHLSASETTIKDGPLKVGDTFQLGEIEEKTRISFFLVADGYRENNWTNPDGENYIDLESGFFEFRTSDDYDLGEAALVTSKSPFLFYVPENGEAVLLQTRTDIDGDIGVNAIYHAAYDDENSLNLNPDGFNHIQHQEVIPGRKWSIGVEDLLHTPDRDGSTFDGDFMDLTFDIQFDP